ncbi:CarR_dom_SF, lycopene cyclase domain [Candidatus Nanopelagicaceae bacterium]|jgi:lycopene cyclase domain-containing protein
MEKFGYVAMLAFTICGSFWLEVVLKVRVLPRIKSAAIAILPVAALFIAWDAYAIHQGHWFFDRKQILGIFGPFNIPLEEYLFFIIVPMAALMTIEAVTKVKPHWRKK